jgi:lysophosphatidate acyltransferase
MHSFMDILYLGRIFPKRASIMAKRELKWMPLLGWFSAFPFSLLLARWNADTIALFASRSEPFRRSVCGSKEQQGCGQGDECCRGSDEATGCESESDCGGRVRQKRVIDIEAPADQVSLWIFPEGTRSSKPEPGLLPFKKGAFHLAIQGKSFPVLLLNHAPLES